MDKNESNPRYISLLLYIEFIGFDVYRFGFIGYDVLHIVFKFSSIISLSLLVYLSCQKLTLRGRLVFPLPPANESLKSL